MYPKIVLLLIFAISLTSEATPTPSSTDTNSDQELADRPKHTNEIESLKSKISEIEDNLEEQIDSKFKENQQQLKNLEDQISDIKSAFRGFNPGSSLSLTRRSFPKNCKKVLENGYNLTGTYTIFPDFAPEPFLVLCDMDSRGGGWTVFLNRFNGRQDFYLNWEDYKKGFGNLAGEFWLGLEHLHQLTGYEVNELLIELEDWDDEEVEAHYAQFGIGSENEGYFLKLLGDYSGDAGDSLSYHAGMKFTTKDRDQDRYKAANCATYRTGAWWYKNCANSHLTGIYLKGTSTFENEFKVMHWDKFRGPSYSLKEARMMVRPKDVRASRIKLH